MLIEVERAKHTLHEEHKIWELELQLQLQNVAAPTQFTSNGQSLDPFSIFNYSSSTHQPSSTSNYLPPQSQGSGLF